MIINPRKTLDMPLNSIVLPKTQIIRPAKIVAKYHLVNMKMLWVQGYRLVDSATSISGSRSFIFTC